MKSLLIVVGLGILAVTIFIFVLERRSSQVILNPEMLDQPHHQRAANEAVAQQVEKASKNLYAHFVGTHGVDYGALASSKEFAEYKKLVSTLNSLNLSSLKNREEKLSFWINIYNSLVIHAVIVFQPKKRVWDTPTFFQKAAYQIGGFRFSLNEIENGILRANQKGPFSIRSPFSQSDPRSLFALSASEFDPRIHFALNCASHSCPPIYFYDSDKIDAQLDTAAKNFIQTETEIENEKIITSSIFKWYRSDFKPDLQAFIEKYLSPEQIIKINGKRLSIEFKNYDWALNAKN